MTGATLERLALTDAVLVDCELSGLTLTGAVLQRVRFEQCRMTGVVAAELNARDVGFIDCQLGGAWFRMSGFERCEFAGCDLTEADFYAARMKVTRLLHCPLGGTEWSEATIDNVALHGSMLDGLRGVEALRSVVISSEQIMPLAIPMMASLGIVVDDEWDNVP